MWQPTRNPTEWQGARSQILLCQLYPRCPLVPLTRTQAMGNHRTQSGWCPGCFSEKGWSIPQMEALVTPWLNRLLTLPCGFSCVSSALVCIQDAGLCMSESPEPSHLWWCHQASHAKDRDLTLSKNLQVPIFTPLCLQRMLCRDACHCFSIIILQNNAWSLFLSLFFISYKKKMTNSLRFQLNPECFDVNPGSYNPT